jgi:hypothetical protein
MLGTIGAIFRFIPFKPCRHRFIVVIVVNPSLYISYVYILANRNVSLAARHPSLLNCHLVRFLKLKEAQGTCTLAAFLTDDSLMTKELQSIHESARSFALGHKLLYYRKLATHTARSQNQLR